MISIFRPWGEGDDWGTTERAGQARRLNIRPSFNTIFLFYLCASAFICGSFLCSPVRGDADKPKVAVFPLGGSASQDLRDKVGFSIRAKLDREGHYEPIDGPTMEDMAADKPIDLGTTPQVLENLSKDAGVRVLIWGQLDGDQQPTLKIKTLDLDQPDSAPHEFQKVIAQPTDMRFVVEDILQTLAGVKKFEHPNEQAVQDDAKARALFDKNPNLVVNGDFAKEGSWEALLESQVYSPPISDKPPAVDQVVIHRLPDDNGQTNNVLAMNLSKTTAENNGFACLSAPIPIQPNTRYRLMFRYRSDGPTLHVFVKGYTMLKNIEGKMAERECYRRQVPPSGATDGKWVTVICDLNPQHVAYPVQHLRVDLYAYLSSGVVMFDDVQLKAVGEQTRHAADDAIKPPSTRQADRP
jgi:hypothetical protein